MQYDPNNGVLLKHKKEWTRDTGSRMDGGKDAMPNERCLSEMTGNVPNIYRNTNRLVVA